MAIGQKIDVRYLSGGLLVELLEGQWTAEDVIETMISQEPPPLGKKYELLFEGEVLGDELPDVCPLELSVAVVNDGPPGEYRAQSNVGLARQGVRRETCLALQGDGFAVCVISDTNESGSGRIAEAFGSWEESPLGVVAVSFTQSRFKDIYRGKLLQLSDGKVWVENTAFKQQITVANEGAHLVVISSDVQEGMNCDAKHMRPATTLERIR